MTQFLVEEAAFIAVDLDDARMRREASDEHQAEQHLLDRHAEMTKLRDAQRVA